jgi:predicted transcriptional regulator
MNGEIKIGIGDERDTAQEFIDIWRHAEQGETPEAPIEQLYFPDLETLLQHLTPRRLALLKTLHTIGPVSVRGLSKELGRDYKNVHTDIQLMERIGLVSRHKNGRVLVPWKRIIAEFRLAA